MYNDNWTQPWPMGSEIYPEVHENPRAFFSSSSPIFLEPLAHGSSDWSLPREDCITCVYVFVGNRRIPIAFVMVSSQENINMLLGKE